MDECIRLHDDRRWTWFFETALRLTWDVHANVGKPYHVGVLQPLCLHAVALVCCTLRYAACGPLHVARCPLRPWPPANVFPAFGRVFLVPCAVRGVFACVRPCAPALHACMRACHTALAATRCHSHRPSAGPRGRRSMGDTSLHGRLSQHVVVGALCCNVA